MAQDTGALVRQAAAFAAQAHASIDQRRKYTQEPYIVHPAEVAALVAHYGGVREEVIAAAWLHDVVEDTPVTLQEVRSVFGDDVAQLVDELTDKTTREMGNRQVRKALECARLQRVSHEAKIIKLADLYSNTRSVLAHDPGFAVIYLGEKATLLTQALSDVEHPLLGVVAQIVVSSTRQMTKRPRWLNEQMQAKLTALASGNKETKSID